MDGVITGPLLSVLSGTVLNDMEMNVPILSKSKACTTNVIASLHSEGLRWFQDLGGYSE